jgi:hypothetical protein
MENPEKLATYEDNQNKTTTHYVLGSCLLLLYNYSTKTINWRYCTLPSPTSRLSLQIIEISKMTKYRIYFTIIGLVIIYLVCGITIINHKNCQSKKIYSIFCHFGYLYQSGCTHRVTQRCVQPDWGYFEWTEQIITINPYRLIQSIFCYDIEKYIYFFKIRQIIRNF